MKDLEKKAHAYALKNAISHNGVCNSGPIISALFNEGLKKEDMKETAPIISKIVKEINSFSLEEQEKEFSKLEGQISKRETREGLPELPDVPKSGVVMRFPPSPSGRLHVGHIRTASLSYLYVKRYGGKLYIRIEDTDPNTIDPEAYKTIPEELEWLFGKNSFIKIIQSDRIELYYKYAEKLIKKDVAYVCTCTSEEFKSFIDQKKECPCRKITTKENLERWEKMLNKKGYKEGDAVLRFKTPEELGGIKHKNPAMRDFPLARIISKPHPLKKNKYKIYPLMNLAVTVDDIELKMTHIIRGKDHRDNAERQKMMYHSLGKKYPWTGFIGRYKFKDVEMSKRKIKAGIESGKYSDWDDPKLMTIASLRKKYSPEVLLKFTEKSGLIEVDKILERKEFFQLLDTIQKELQKQKE